MYTGPSNKAGLQDNIAGLGLTGFGPYHSFDAIWSCSIQSYMIATGKWGKDMGLGGKQQSTI